MKLTTFIIAIKNWNNDLKSIHVKSLQSKNEKKYDSLIFTFKSIANAKKAKLHKIIMTKAIHSTKIYNRKYKMRQCFNCQKYEHFFTRCINKIKCEKCVHDHNTSLKNKFESLCLKTYSNKCVNCEQKHSSWNKQCSFRKKEYKRIKIVRLNTSKKYIEKNSKNYCRNVMNSISTNLNESNSNQKYTLVEAKKKKTIKNNTATLKQFQNHSSSINFKLDAKKTSHLQSHKKTKIDNKSRSLKKINTFTQIKQARQFLTKSNHIMNTKSVNNNQKRTSQKIKQKNDENRSIIISNSFSETQIFFFSKSSQW